MQFTRALRDRVRRGEITCSVRVWTRPHVKVGGRYQLGWGEIEVDAIIPITEDDISPAMARRCGFDAVEEMMKIARHGRGRNVYLIEFRYLCAKVPK